MKVNKNIIELEGKERLLKLKANPIAFGIPEATNSKIIAVILDA